MTVSTDEVVTEEVSPVIAGDITEVTEKLDELKEVLTEEKKSEKIIVNETEMTEQEILAEMLTTMQSQNEPDPEQEKMTIEQQQMQQTNAETEIELLQQIFNALETQQATTLENQELALERHEQLVEGNFFVGLTIVISFAVYMFWNQLSKW